MNALSFAATRWWRTVKLVLSSVLAALLLGGAAVVGVCSSGLGGAAVCGPAGSVEGGNFLYAIAGLVLGLLALRSLVRTAAGWTSLTASGRQLRLDRRFGAARVVDTAPLARIACFTLGSEAAIKYLALVTDEIGPPLLILEADDWPSGMATSLGEYLGVPVDQLGSVPIDKLREKYPNHARAAAAARPTPEQDWSGRPWKW